MAPLSTFHTLFNLFLFFFLFYISNHNSHARLHHPKTSDSLVLGLTNARTTIKLPKQSSTLNLKLSSQTTLDMIEPLREVRDGYLISLNLGSPPQLIQVYMDTGSDLTWVPCGNLSFNCIDCDDYTPMSKYSPLHSSSCVRDSCTSQLCIDVHSSDNPYDPCYIVGCSLSSLIKGTCSRPCPTFVYTYGEGVVAGTLTRDTLRVHGSTEGVTREIANFNFGCVGSTYREPIGIAGFGKGSLSLPSQLGFLQKGFSHCFLAFKFANNPNVSSPLVVGDLAISSKEHLQFTQMLKNPMYPNSYYIGLEGITLGTGSGSMHIRVPTNLKNFDSSGNGGMLIDSGTTYTHLPQPFYSQLLAELESLIDHPRATEMEERTGFDLCYRVPCVNNVTNGMKIMDVDDHLLPSITFHFMNNVSLVLPQGNNFYAMSAPRNSTVVKCLLFQSMDDEDYGPAGVFGSFQQQNVEVVYDMQKERIGFQTMDCASSLAFQQLHKP